MPGPDLLVAPISQAAARNRPVYPPHGTRWIDTATGAARRCGETLYVAAPLERIPVFIRAASPLTDTRIY